jgi:hypothetical protein
MNKAFNIDIRILYVVLILCVLIPLIKPMGLPLTITAMTRGAYDSTAAVPKGAIVLYGMNVTPQNEAENLPQAIAMLKHDASLGHRLVLATFDPAGGPYLDRVGKEILEPMGYVYGKDYVSLPYRAGQETAVASLGEDINGLYKNDAFGKPLSGLPIMADVKTIKDVALCQVFGAGDEGNWFVRQIQAKFGTPMNMGTVAVGISMYGPFYSSKQFKGLLVGQSGAAEYETLIKQPGKGLAAMDAQSIGHMYMIGLIVLGNVIYFLDRRAAKGGK